MANYIKVGAAEGGRTVLHDALGLTGAEISINNVPAGGGVPFFHAHKKNEEIYYIISGKGTAEIDGETFELEAGDWVKVAPAGMRKFSAAADSPISYICIQVKENSLEEFTGEDAIMG
ncbi:MAG: cupin domain-containing protein [Lachnospiraceae bacterium]|nr:cupin domain-containing protein [Lachnospiraceae bacterium]